MEQQHSDGVLTPSSSPVILKPLPALTQSPNHTNTMTTTPITPSHFDMGVRNKIQCTPKVTVTVSQAPVMIRYTSHCLRELNESSSADVQGRDPVMFQTLQ